MSIPLEISLDNKDRSPTLCFSKVNWKNRRYSSPPFGMPSPLSTRILKFCPFTAWYRRQSIPHVSVWLGDRFRGWFLIENDYYMFSRWPKHLIFPSVCQFAIWFMRPYPIIRVLNTWIYCPRLEVWLEMHRETLIWLMRNIRKRRSRIRQDRWVAGKR